MSRARSKYRKIRDALMVFAHKVGNFQARVLLTIFYIVLICPIALLAKLFGDPFAFRRKKAFWTPRNTPDAGLDDLKRQF